MIPAWTVPLVMTLQRLLELAVSRRNLRLALAQGGREFHPGSFRVIAAMHALFIVSLLIGSWGGSIRTGARTFLLLGLLVLLQVGRYWCMASLGESWNTRIVAVPGGSAVRRGPYRFLRHPNYLVVTLEFLLIPLLLEAWWVLAVFFPLNLLVLRRRIELEERVLAEQTDYAARFGEAATAPGASP
ncbi:MAG TPA: isoprenylcysteine carboxylmethyltransferase family protein [Verrucomicrobiae bacterium]|nr:isoprenylcysteine carboxylmethyltransferase family protein [Verrucomicrobiae bacterium]